MPQVQVEFLRKSGNLWGLDAAVLVGKWTAVILVLAAQNFKHWTLVPD
jgi:hypothetical protein